MFLANVPDLKEGKDNMNTENEGWEGGAYSNNSLWVIQDSKLPHDLWLSISDNLRSGYKVTTW